MKITSMSAAMNRISALEEACTSLRAQLANMTKMYEERATICAHQATQSLEDFTRFNQELLDMRKDLLYLLRCARKGAECGSSNVTTPIPR